MITTQMIQMVGILVMFLITIAVLCVIGKVICDIKDLLKEILKDLYQLRKKP